MPFITPKKTVPALSLPWDSFPPPPPEAEAWQPPKDSIPKPGVVRDSRFNRDVGQGRRGKASKIKVKATLSPPVASTSSTRMLGQWPAQASRATPRPFFNDGDHEQSLTNGSKQTITVDGKSSTDTVKSTPMRVLENKGAHSTPTSKNCIPAWAMRIEELLAEKAQKSSPSIHLTSATVATETLISQDVTAPATSASRLVTSGTRFHGAQQVTVSGSHAYVDHAHKIKVMTIRAMEHELDLASVATERELMCMSSSDLDRYYAKALSAHKCWWDAKSAA